MIGAGFCEPGATMIGAGFCEPAVLAGVLSLAVAFALAVGLTPIVRRWARRRDFVDRPGGPGGHKAHERPTPFGGGIAITVGVIVPIAAVLVAARCSSPQPGGFFEAFTAWAPDALHWLGGIGQKTPEALAIIAGALVMHLLGLMDDHRPLPPMLKLVVQAVTALVLTGWFGVRAAEALGPVVAVVVSSLWIVALTNAFNFMDNMDGLSAGVAVIAAMVLAVSAFLAGQVFVPCLLLLVAGAVGGFLVYNFPPASIFMGDAGSLVVGYLLAVCTILTTFYDPDMGRTPFGVLVPLVVFAVPLYDMGSVIVYRLHLGVSIFRSDRRHFSHRLVRRGLSPRLAVLTVYLATLATSLPAILLPLHGWPVAMLILAQCLAVVAIIAILELNDGT